MSKSTSISFQMIVLAVKVYLDYLKEATTINGVHDPDRYTPDVASFLDTALIQCGLDNVRMFSWASSDEIYQESVAKYWGAVSSKQPLVANHPHKIRPMISGGWLKMVFTMWQGVEFGLMEVSKVDLSNQVIILTTIPGSDWFLD